MKLAQEIRRLDYRPAAVVHVGGEDAHAFLQSQFSNDLGRSRLEKPVYGLWLDRKGRVLADSTVLPDPDGVSYWLASVACPAAVILGHLNAHIVADDVALSDETAGWAGICLMGSGAAAAGPQLPPGLGFAGRRGAESWEWLVRADRLAEASSAVSGAALLTAAEAERARIAAAVPAVPADIGPSDLPAEGGLDVDAVSYSKGCYTGQEVMARIRALGRVRRRLIRVASGSPAPRLPAPLWGGGKRLGEVRSAVSAGGGFEGLALVPVSAAAPGSLFSLSEAGPETVRAA
ncbi:MAG TPA: folate-binding protein [Opitutaceae bacterium]|jgi:hypothetical protein